VESLSSQVSTGTERRGEAGSLPVDVRLGGAFARARALRHSSSEQQRRPGSFPLVWAVPLERLSGDRGDALEVPVPVQKSQPLQLGRGGHHEVDGSGAAVLSALGEDLLDLPGAVVGAVVDRHPPEEQAHVVDALCPVRSGTCAAEELQLGDGTGGDEPGGRRLVPSELLSVAAQEAGERAGIDQVLRGVHRR